MRAFGPTAAARRKYHFARRAAIALFRRSIGSLSLSSRTGPGAAYDPHFQVLAAANLLYNFVESHLSNYCSACDNEDVVP
ncbi:hypothetical protein DF3PB_850008 [uncultured Defluviicoccus sp.]|uniref:Uncharacterized protein n=1 Tax=metagenome TaxID=256318 RepID=A0A380TLX8_9ZZZZ|nr:hypothetical protein DF3PB_850008 [uncultured Defluviicoccus sp.]